MKMIQFTVVIKEGICSKAIITPGVMRDQTVVVSSGMVKI